MVRVITQETFDEVVKENMDEFSMERAEAVQEAKDQFLSQGVSLDNIVLSEEGSQIVVESVKSLFGEIPDQEILLNLLTKIQECCESDLAQRVLATNSGAYSVLIRLAKEGQHEVQCESLKTLSRVMNMNPDHLEGQGLELMYDLLSSPKESLLTANLDWMLICCVMHEGNRQSLVNRPGLLNRLTELANEGDKAVVTKVCKIWVQLVQDDDIRVPFGKAHETARDIVENQGALTVLTRALQKNRSDSEVMSGCLLALASLCLRNEYCQEVADEGGLTVLMDIFSNRRDEGELVTRALILLKVLAGNDKVKTEVGKTGGIPLILASIVKYLPRASTVEAGCNALTTICLRQPDNSKQVVLECDGAAAITAIMEQHPKHTKTQQAAAAAIRNIVSRDKDLKTPFIERGVEELLNNALSLHGDKIGDTLRSALRDLDLQVELQERWTGEKIQIRESFDVTEGVHD